ncbi:hypothetical protein, partial [Escherichia coli]
KYNAKTEVKLVYFK